MTDPDVDTVHADWRAWAAQQPWQEARSYAKTYPHAYIIAGLKGAPPLPEIREHIRAIDRFGETRLFGRRRIPYQYLVPGDGFMYWFHGDVETSTGINRAPDGANLQ